LKPVDLVALTGALYASKNFAKEASYLLHRTAIGVVPTHMSRDLELSLENLVERLKELG
jgi:hypothetical protein